MNVFGIWDYATEIMTDYVYHEGEGCRGSNNVTSLIWKYLCDEGIIQLSSEKGPGKKLSPICDNCGGQNKKRTVIRFASWLVDKKIYSEVEIVFLIKGHIKNICDRMFSVLKHTFRHQNVMTFQNMISVLNESPNVNCFEANHLYFYDWDTYFDGYYKRPRSGTIFQNHCFKFNISLGSGRLETKIARTDPTPIIPELKKGK